MTSAAAEFAPIRLSTDDLPERDRIAIWREVTGPVILRLDLSPVRDHEFRSDAVMRALPGLAMQWGFNSGICLRRTRNLISDGNDDLILPLSTAGMSLHSQRDAEVTLAEGNSVLMSSADVGCVTCFSGVWFTLLRLPRKALAEMVIGVEDMLMRPIPGDNEALRLLRSYVNVLRDDHALETPELRHRVVAHVHDLVALTLGATRDVRAVAEGRGVRAARVHQIVAEIEAGFSDAGSSAACVARKLGLSARYVQELLSETGRSFTDRVIELRLQKARTMLADPRCDGMRVSDIAYGSGFNDISYFNRSFRRRFGASPLQYRGGNGQQP